MILRRVVIKNFRQFRDVDIDFAHNDEKNISMILGGNGTGKTNFLNAISWCLYGVEIHDFRDSSLDICNKKAAHLALIGDEVIVGVELEFLDEDEILIFSRFQGFYKSSDGLRHIPSSNKFELRTKEGNEIRINDSPFYTIERKIPREIQDYFLFDETRLNEYFYPTRLKQLKNAISHLTQIDLIENINSSIQKVKTHYINQQKELTPKLGRANEMIDELEKNIRISREQLGLSEKEIEKLMDEIDKIDEELINKKSTDVQRDLIRNKELDKKIKQFNKEMCDLEDKLEKHVLLKYPYVISYNSILQFVEVADDYMEKGYIPRDVKFFIKNLLRDGYCICGTDLSIDTEHRRILEDFLEKTEEVPSPVENLFEILEYIQTVIIEDIKNFKYTSLEYHREISTLKKERDAFIDEKRDIEARLRANPVEEVDRLIHLRKDLITHKNNLEKKIPILKNSLEKDLHLLGHQRKLLSHQDELYMEFEKYQKKIDLCYGVSFATDSLQNNLKQDIRRKIQDLTKEYLILSHWRDEEFSDLIIDSDFNINIRNFYGNIERPTDLSDGEKTVLIICFICALHRLFSFNLPIILDVSFSNLDSESRINLINSLPDLIGYNQFILLSKDEEYYKKISDYILNEYNIKKINSAEGIESEVILNG